jgi:hypothetical protein
MSPPKKRHGAVHLASLTAGVIDPITAKRGFAKADLVSLWSDIVGPRYAGTTQPERLHWPRGGYGAILTVRVAGASAIFLQHESAQFLERVNSFLGHRAVAELRIVQRPMARPGPSATPPELPAEEMEAVRGAVAAIDPGGLRDALERLGAAIASDRLARP